MISALVCTFAAIGQLEYVPAHCRTERGVKVCIQAHYHDRAQGCRQCGIAPPAPQRASIFPWRSRLETIESHVAKLKADVDQLQRWSETIVQSRNINERKLSDLELLARQIRVNEEGLRGQVSEIRRDIDELARFTNQDPGWKPRENSRETAGENEKKNPADGTGDRFDPLGSGQPILDRGRDCGDRDVSADGLAEEKIEIRITIGGRWRCPCCWQPASENCTQSRVRRNRSAVQAMRRDGPSD